MQKMTTLTTTQKTILLTGLLALCVTGLPNMAEAQELFSAGTNFLQALVDLLTNTWARLLGVISVGINWSSCLIPAIDVDGCGFCSVWVGSNLWCSHDRRFC